MGEKPVPTCRRPSLIWHIMTRNAGRAQLSIAGSGNLGLLIHVPGGRSRPLRRLMPAPPLSTVQQCLSRRRQRRKLSTAPQRSADTNRSAAIQSSPIRAQVPASGPYRPGPTALRVQRCPGCCLARYALTAALRRWSAGTTLPASLAEAFVARRPAFLRASSDTTTFFSFRCATTHLRGAIGRADGTAGERS